MAVAAQWVAEVALPVEEVPQAVEEAVEDVVAVRCRNVRHCYGRSHTAVQAEGVLLEVAEVAAHAAEVIQVEPEATGVAQE